MRVWQSPYTLMLAAVFTTSCYHAAMKKSLGPGLNHDSDSEVTAINIGLPDREPLKQQVADIETLMNGYHLVITPRTSACAAPTTIDQVAPYAAKPILNVSLKQGCDYAVTLRLGNLPQDPTTSAPTKLTTTYYETTAAKLIAKSDIDGKSTLTIKLVLNLLPAGKDIGLVLPETTDPDGTQVGNEPGDGTLKVTNGSGGERGKKEISYGGSRYWINAPATNGPDAPNGILVLLHGSSASSYDRFIDSMEDVAIANDLIPISVLAPNGRGWNEGDQDQNAAFLNDLLENEIFKKYNINLNRVIFSGQSSGAGFLSSHFVAKYTANYRGGALMQCGASKPRTAFTPTAEQKSHFSLHFEITSGDGIWTSSFKPAVDFYKNAGLSVTSDNTKSGGHCQFDQAKIIETYVKDMLVD